MVVCLTSYDQRRGVVVGSNTRNTFVWRISLHVELRTNISFGADLSRPGLAGLSLSKRGTVAFLLVPVFLAGQLLLAVFDDLPSLPRTRTSPNFICHTIGT